ncbi:CopG family transcriptional regulator [Acetivibrio sp. MSJd-27]|uniref:CopG family transcriptional regulator n=1 Tax=Acetivibrio sp. MSJd-27 TaxID=2841523 RepID=UPI00209D2AF0|nr:CopG family transcriptional regulator [Acetivibrio sp. MSJd-27]
MILVTHKSEVKPLGKKKMGRPTDNPKDISLKVLLDNDTAQKLEECSQVLKVSKAEIMRRGVHEIHKRLPN